MSLDFTILRSTVGQRFFLLFVLCALLPIGVLSLVSFHSVSGELQEQSASRLQQLAKTQLMAIVERLELLGVELQVAAEGLPATASGDVTRLLGPAGSWMHERVLSLRLLSGSDGAEDPEVRPAAALPRILNEPGFLDPTRTTVALRATSDTPARLFLGLAIDEGRPAQGTLWAEIDPRFAWWGPQLENNLPPATELCVLDATRTAALYCTTPSKPLQDLLSAKHAQVGRLTWNQEDTEYLASFRTANLRSQFDIAGLTVAVSQERSYLLRPLADFKRFFPPIIVASLGLVLLLSIGQIRKRLVPLERLQSGTQRIAARDFSARIEVDSGDEFEQLAENFNAMADRLGKQFGALRSMNEIVQAVLSALDREEIVRSILGNFGLLLPCKGLSVTLFQETSPGTARVCLRSPESAEGVHTSVVEIAERELRLLRENPQRLVIEADSHLTTLWPGADSQQIRSIAAFPVFVDDQLTGVISAGFAPGITPEEEDLGRARQLADQVAVAFSNSKLLQQLEELSQGALTALARSIDAKSHWTAGHSERVARMAVVVGRGLGLSAEDLETLERGSLLHDLGKIGVSSKILDKPGRLTQTELEIVRGHVLIGARILEPIAQLGSLLPLVLQHHERYDGAGYPAGLAGEQISLLARLLSVVDVYDALRSSRPYRAALSHSTIMRELAECAGTQFDPIVVGAFVKSEAWSAGWPPGLSLSEPHPPSI